MKTVRIALSLTVLAILWCTDVFAHGVGKCNSQGYRIEHFDPHTEEDPCRDKDCGKTYNYKDGHGHINYADINGNGFYDSGDCKHSWGYWVKGGYDIVMNGGNMEEEFVDCGSRVWSDCSGSNGNDDVDDNNNNDDVDDNNNNDDVDDNNNNDDVDDNNNNDDVDDNNNNDDVDDNNNNDDVDDNNNNDDVDDNNNNDNDNDDSNNNNGGGSNNNNGGGDNDRDPGITPSPRPSIPSIITTSTTITPPTTPKPTLVMISGNNQEGLPGQTLANPFIVKVYHDDTSIPLVGVVVRFTVLTGDGSLSATALSTNSGGRAASTLTLGWSAGTNTVRASVRGASEAIVFTAEGTSSEPPAEETSSEPPLPTPATLTIVSGDNQSGIIGGTLASPFVVDVQDGSGDPSVGVAVTFVVTMGGGSLNPETTVTRPDGRAASTLTLGWSAGANSVQVSAEDVSQTVTFNATAQAPVFDLSVPSGVSLVHVPLEVTSVDGVADTIESVADLYDALGGATTVKFLVTYNLEAQGWYSYIRDSHRGTIADKTLVDDTGIIAAMHSAVTIRLRGNPLGTNGSGTINLHPGANLVGLPLDDPRINRVSSLFVLDGIMSNVSAITLAGDVGNIQMTGGQGFFLIAAETATVTISGSPWHNVSTNVMTAPPIAAWGSDMDETTPVLALTGSIVDRARRLNSANLRVTVKNLSTGTVVPGVIEDTGSTPSQIGYQLTIVDMERQRAAQIGDILEISVKSPDTSIAVQPLRYTVTVEDIQQLHVQLPELALNEIPVETQLLRNYPNPFNPETWIPYRLAADAFVTLTIYDVNGQIVRTLDIGHQTAAVYESRSKAVYWDGRNGVGEPVASGIYFYTLTANDFSATRKMVILK